MITGAQAKLVQRSFTLFRNDLARFAEVLYVQLFAECPEIRYMFRGDQKDQERKLAGMLETLIDALDRSDDITATLQDLGRAHVTYGVREKDYQAFGEALIWTVEKFLHPDFTPELREAWRAFYAHVSGSMLAHGR